MAGTVAGARKRERCACGAFKHRGSCPKPGFKPVAERFWRKVDARDPSECWLWRGAVSGNGYGNFHLRQENGKHRQVSAHIMAYCLAVGMPENHVLHRCDVPLCCNPSHLYDGTPLQNMTDKHLRGRGRYLCGEEHRQAKLTWERVRAIRADPRPASALAVEHGVHKLYIRKIRRGEIWKES